MKVADALALKGNLIVTVKPTETIGALSALLREKRIGAAVVSADGHAVEGVISERDIAYGLATHGAGLHAMLVSALMTRTVITCTPRDDIGHVASTMMSRNIRHIPIVQDDRLVGMVSIRDVLKSRLDELQQQAAQLRVLVNQVDRVPQDR